MLGPRSPAITHIRLHKSLYAPNTHGRPSRRYECTCIDPPSVNSADEMLSIAPRCGNRVITWHKELHGAVHLHGAELHVDWVYQWVHLGWAGLAKARDFFARSVEKANLKPHCSTPVNLHYNIHIQVNCVFDLLVLLLNTIE